MPDDEAGRLLGRFERDAVVACLVMAAGALAVERGRPDAAVGVLAGGVLSAFSYLAIRGGATAVLDAAARMGRGAARGAGEGGEEGPQPEPGLPAGHRAWMALKFFGRYALLAVGAYVMLSCFRVHPVGLLVGATSPFVAAAAFVVRSFGASSRRGHS